MDESLELLLSDLTEALHAIKVEDLTMPFGFLLWTVILFFPLWRIDRRDLSTAVTYVLYCMGSGVALVFALPQGFTEPPTLKTQIVATVCMAGVASLRWGLKWNRLFVKEIRTQKSFAEEDEEFGRRNAKIAEADARGAGKAAI